jgi:glutamate carboxypeptidase
VASSTDSTASGAAAGGGTGGAAEFDAAPGEPIGARVAAEIRTRLEPRRAEMADLLVELTAIESPTDDPTGLDRMAGRPAELFARFGPLARHPIGPGGASHLVLSVDGAAPAASDRLPCAAVLGHYDTVWPTGSIERSPACVDSAGIATGPGCFDMKGGLVQLYYALAEPHRLGRPSRTPTTSTC